MVGGILNASRMGKSREETLCSHHPIAEFSTLEQFNQSIVKMILLWLLCLLAVIMLGYV
jgi:hypothetical protein